MRKKKCFLKIFTFTWKGTVIHELMHMLAASHEMQRPDRHVFTKEAKLKSRVPTPAQSSTHPRPGRTSGGVGRS
jgi:hypothetical protein